MWRSAFTTGYRSMARSRANALINLLGLALGLAAFVAILLFIRYETSYDAELPGADRAFQLQQWNTGSEERGGPGTQLTSFRSGMALRKDFPQIDRVVYVGKAQPAVLQDGQASTTKDFVFVDGPLFDILRLPFLRGNRATALALPGNIVLTEREALKRYGTASVVGRTLTLIIAGKPVDYRITGIVANPVHSHLALSMVARYDPQSFYTGSPNFLTGWMPKNGWVYARLRPGVPIEDIAVQMPAWKKRNIPDETVGGARNNPGDTHDWRLINIRDIHLGALQDGSMTPGNDRRTVMTFSVIGLLILGMAIFNFINLSTARAGIRAREIALRKLAGATRRQIVLQFLGESVAMSAAAMLMALALIELALPTLNAFLGTTMAIAYLGVGGILPWIALLILAVGIAGGLYPALVLSRFRPALVLKSNRSTAETPGAGRLRTTLVVAQFAIAIGLFICTAIIAAQTDFARTTDPGFRREGLLQIANVNRRAIAPRVPALAAEIARVPGVHSVARSTIGVATFGMDNMLFSAPQLAEPAELNLYRIDANFFTTMGIPRLAGRTFSAARAMDDSTVDVFADDASAQTEAMTTRGYNIVVNAHGARLLGYRSPSDAIGKTLSADDESDDSEARAPVTIVGVVGDARLRSVRDPLEPMVFVMDRVQPGWLIVRYDGPAAQVRAEIERVWRRIVPDAPFDAQFSSDVVEDLYSRDAARAVLFAGFSGLAVVIGCLGLFGLAAFTTQRRTKEIGIRKVLGARVRDIVRLLTWQFSKPVILANLVAWPIAWWVMRDWLNGFDARIALTLTPFVTAGALALVIAVVTVAGHAIRVARLSPIHALRYE